jgi:Secretion system C-terminal sorting domain
LGSRWTVLVVAALLVVSTPYVARAAKPQPPPPQPTIAGVAGFLAVATDGTVYEINVANATCAASLSSATVYGHVFPGPQSSPIVSVQSTGIGLQVTLANGDMWMMNDSCCTPCYKQGTYLGNIFTVAGTGSRLPDAALGNRELAEARNSANPTTGASRIEYQTPRSGSVEVQVFDVQGRLVWSTRSEHGSPGRYTVAWDSKDVASGVYFAKIQLPDGTLASDRIVVAR